MTMHTFDIPDTLELTIMFAEFFDSYEDFCSYDNGEVIDVWSIKN